MRNREWEVGKKYRLADVEGFVVEGGTNIKIAKMLGNDVFTISGTGNGKVFLIEGYDRDDLDIIHWFNAEEIKYFEEVEESVSTTQKQPCPVYSCPVHEWLMKLGYVVATDHTITGLMVKQESKEVFICTDFGDITGVQEVIDYVSHNYAAKIKQDANKCKQELEDKRAKVLAELSMIDKELENY